MRRFSTGIGATVVMLVLCLPGCSDVQMPFEPESVREAPRPFFSQEPAPGFDVLRRSTSLRKDERRSRVIGERGGTIRLRKAGVELVIPRGALTRATRITVTAPAGDAVAVTFAPHGLQFQQPATVRVWLPGTNATSAGFQSFLGVYFLGDGVGTVTPLETFRARVQGDHLSFSIDHFSGYATAGG